MHNPSILFFWGEGRPRDRGGHVTTRDRGHVTEGAQGGVCHSKAESSESTFLMQLCALDRLASVTGAKSFIQGPKNAIHCVGGRVT